MINTILPVQPITTRKSSADRKGRDKRENQEGFSTVLHGMMVAHVAKDRRDGFSGGSPQHRSEQEQIAAVLRRIEQVNLEITGLYF